MGGARKDASPTPESTFSPSTSRTWPTNPSRERLAPTGTREPTIATARQETPTPALLTLTSPQPTKPSSSVPSTSEARCCPSPRSHWSHHPSTGPPLVLDSSYGQTKPPQPTGRARSPPPHRSQPRSPAVRRRKIGRASCREQGGTDVTIPGVAVT